MKNINLSLSSKVFIVTSLLCVATVAVAADSKAKQETSPAPVSPVAVASKMTVARVNGIAIDAVELRRAKKVLLRGQKVPAGQEADFDKQAIEQLVSAELLYQAASKQEIKDLDKLIEEKLALGKSRFNDDADFKKAIKDLEMDDKDLREYTRRDILISRYVETNFVAKTKVTEAETRAFYDGNPDKFKQNESVKASHILIGVDEKASADDKKKALEKAEKLQKEVAGGADFAAIAKANSTCPSAKQGGDLGFFGKGQMVPEFEKAAFGLKTGEISPVVETKFGYHVIKLTDKKSASSIDFKDVKAKIEDFLKGQKVNAAIQAYLTETRKTAKVEILLK